MKVRLPKEYKKLWTVHQLELAKALIAFEKEYDEEKPEGWIEYAIRAALNEKSNGLDSIDEIIRASAEVARNHRIWNIYGETEDLDIWIKGLAKTTNGYIEVEAYLTDINDISYENSQTEHMYIRYFTESR